MQSRTPEETDPHDIFVIEPDVVLAARVDQPLAEPSQERLSQDKTLQDRPSAMPKQASPVEDIMGDILSRPSTPKLRVVPEVSVAAPAKPARPADVNFRATAATADAIANEIKVPGDIHLNGARSSRGAWAKRATFGFLFALGSVAAAEGWDRYGDTARQMMADWTPALTSSQPATTTAVPPQAAPPAVETAVTDQAPAPPALAAIQSATATATATPAAAPDQTQTLQSMTQDLAAMGQQIEALKASIAQLKAGQEQMAQQISRDMVKNAVARTSDVKPSELRTPERPHTLAPRPLRKPPQASYAPPPSAAAMNVPPPYPARPLPSAAPMQAQPPVETEAPDGGPVVRPPMPLH